MIEYTAKAPPASGEEGAEGAAEGEAATEWKTLLRE